MLKNRCGSTPLRILNVAPKIGVTPNKILNSLDDLPLRANGKCLGISQDLNVLSLRNLRILNDWLICKSHRHKIAPHFMKVTSNGMGTVIVSKTGLCEATMRNMPLFLMLKELKIYNITKKSSVIIPVV